MHPTHKIQHDTYYRVLATYQTYYLFLQLFPGGPIPHNMAKTFDAPPSLERSGSGHRRAVTSHALLERVRAWEWVKDPPARGSVPYKGNRKGRKDY